MLPAVLVTNDWYTALIPAYVRSRLFGQTFDGTTFFHIIHNLSKDYEVAPLLPFCVTGAGPHLPWPRGLRLQ